VAKEDVRGNGEHTVEQARGANHQTEQCRKLQRDFGEGDESGSGEAEHRARRILASAGEAGARVEFQRAAPEPYPGDETSQKTISLAKISAKHVQHSPRQESEVGPVRLDAGRGHAVDQPIEGASAHLLEQPGVGRLPADGLHDVVALAPFRDNFGNERRRVLQVGVHTNYRIGFRVIHSCRKRRLVAEVARQVQHGDPVGMAIVEPVEDLRRAVGRAVVHENDHAGERKKIDRLEQRADEAFDALHLIVHGRNDGEARIVHVSGQPPK
jgi:hypothetical protein